MTQHEQLWAIVTCCSRVNDHDDAVGLGLRICGLSDEEIAARFLSVGDVIEKRLDAVRIQQDDVATACVSAFDVRLPAVIQVIYLLFTSGYVSGLPDAAHRCGGALALALALRDMLPAQDADVEALLALMSLHHARRDARFDGAGELVPLRDQVRARWDRSLIDQGLRFLDSALYLTTTDTALLLQARIAAVHATAEVADRTDWVAVVDLYDQLYWIEPSPIVALNRAIAVSMVSGPSAALPLVDVLRPDLGKYYVWHATRGDLLSRLGRVHEAVEHFLVALAFTPDPTERRFFRKRLVELGESE